MCCKKEKKEPKMPALERDIEYAKLVNIHVSNTRKNLNFKIIFQYLFSLLLFLLIPTLTVLLALFVINVKNFGFKDDEVVVSLIASFSSYAISLIGILVIILNYIFNKNDFDSNNKIMAKVLAHENESYKNSQPYLDLIANSFKDLKNSDSCATDENGEAEKKE